MPETLRPKTLRELRQVVEHPRVGPPTLRRVIEELKRRASPSAAELLSQASRVLRRILRMQTERKKSLAPTVSATSSAPSASRADELVRLAEAALANATLRLDLLRTQIVRREVTLTKLEHRVSSLRLDLEVHIESLIPDSPHPSRWGGSLRLAELRRTQLSKLREEATRIWPGQAEFESTCERLERLRHRQEKDRERCATLAAGALEKRDALSETRHLARQMRFAEAAERESRLKTAKLMASLADENALVIYASSLVDTGKSELSLIRELRSRGAEDPVEILVRARIYKRHSDGKSK